MTEQTWDGDMTRLNSAQALERPVTSKPRSRKIPGGDKTEYMSWADCALALDESLPLLWSRVLVEAPKAEVETIEKADVRGNVHAHYVARARAIVRLELGPCGSPWATHEDLGHCESMPNPNMQSAIEFAEGGAVSNAFRRCARVLGPRLGLGVEDAKGKHPYPNADSVVRDIGGKQHEAEPVHRDPKPDKPVGTFKRETETALQVPAGRLGTKSTARPAAGSSSSSPTPAAAPPLGQDSHGATTYGTPAEDPEPRAADPEAYRPGWDLGYVESLMRREELPEGDVRGLLAAAADSPESLTSLTRELWLRCVRAKKKKWAENTFKTCGFEITGNGSDPTPLAAARILVELHKVTE